MSDHVNTGPAHPAHAGAFPFFHHIILRGSVGSRTRLTPFAEAYLTVRSHHHYSSFFFFLDHSFRVCPFSETFHGAERAQSVIRPVTTRVLSNNNPLVVVRGERSAVVTLQPLHTCSRQDSNLRSWLRGPLLSSSELQEL
jgi:hypothetical protein